MKKVLISSFNLDFGGIEKSLITLLKNFNYEKYKITLVLEEKKGIFLNDVPNNVVIKEYKVSKNKNVLVRKFINLIKEIKWIIFNYKKYDCSISFATYSRPCSFIARTSSNNKILYVHSNYYQMYNEDKILTKNFFDNLGINNFNHIIFVSNESRYDLAKIYKDISNKFITINNLIDYENILKLSNEKIDIKNDYNKICLFVGRLDESSKKIFKLLDIALNCKKDNLKVKFWIVGSGPDEEKYKKFTKEKKIDNVVFFGAKKNPYSYMKMCDYLILTSKYEGFPVVYNEAVILNKKIITTIDVSDDFITIPNRFGYILDKDNMYNDFKKIIEKDDLKMEKVDFEKLNQKRLDKIERLIDND